MKRILYIILGVLLFVSIRTNIINATGFELSTERVTGIDVAGTEDPDNSDPKALYIAVKVINWILSLTSVVAIIVFLIGGFKVILSNGDETKAKGGYKILKNATIGLVIIGLTRAIIRLIFRFTDRAAGSGDFTT